MSDVIDLASVRRRKKEAAEGWREDEGIVVTVEHDPECPNHPVIRTETSDFVVECSLTPEEAWVFAYRLLNIANAPRGVVLRGHADGEDA